MKWDKTEISETKRDDADQSMKTIPLTSGTGKKVGFRGRRGNPANAPRCGAKTRAGAPCKRPTERNPYNGRRVRCRLHGGWSTGARTEAGLARIAAANFRHGRRTKAFKEAQRALRAKLKVLKAQTKETK